jgi:hypothetical protein
MNGRSSRRARARLTRAALVAVVAFLALVAVPGTASAGNNGVTPFLDCLRQNPNGSYTAVLGYTNTSRTAVTIPRGTWNKISPSKYDGPQPTVFEPGTKHGAVTVTISKNEYMGGPYWWLDGEFVYWGWAWTHDGGAATCPSSTELPEEGNGTGPAIALLAAGLVGAVLVQRANRRARALAAASRGDA